MKKRYYIGALALISMMALTSCNSKPSLKSFMKNAQDSTKSVTKIETSAQVTDKDVLVYSLDKTLEITEGDSDIKAVITTESTTLNSYYEYVTVSHTEEVADSLKNIVKFNYDLSKDNLEEYTLTKEKLEAKIASENADECKITEVAIESADDINLVIVMADKKLSSVSISYQTTSGKNVTIDTTYTY